MYKDWLEIEQDGSSVVLKKCSEEAQGEVVIPKGVTIIADNAFYCCGKVTGVHIPDGVKSIGRNAFVYCDLKELYIPASVTKLVPNGTGFLASTPFYGNGDLIKITVDKRNPVFDSRNDCNAIIEKKTNRLVLGCKNTTIPDSVSIIGNGSFFCNKMDTISIPTGVKAIEHYAFYYSFMRYVIIPDNTHIKKTSFRKTTKVIQNGDVINEEFNGQYFNEKYFGLKGFEITERNFREYYPKCFHEQLNTYFSCKETNGSNTQIERIDNDSNYRWASESPGRDMKENYMFAAILLYMITAGQSIYNLASGIYEDFHRGLGWPMLCYGPQKVSMGHPLELLEEAGLSPLKYESLLFLHFTKRIFPFLRQQMNTILNGKKSIMKDLAAGKRFAEGVTTHKRAGIKRHMDKQEKEIQELLAKWAISKEDDWREFLVKEGGIQIC